MNRFTVKRSRLNQDLLLVLIMVLAILGLYSLAGTSDRLEPLTAKQQSIVISWWYER